MNQNPSSLSLIKSNAPSAIHRAKWIMLDSSTIMENGCMETSGGKITRIFSAGNTGNTEGMHQADVIDHGEVLLMPVFINAHCHLELSALHNALPMENGFAAWVQALLQKRQALGNDALLKSARLHAENLNHHGTGFLADISTLGITRTLFEENIISGIWFREHLGNEVPESDICQKEFSWFSIAGHAPHTTNPNLLHAMKEVTKKNGLPFSIHLGESEEEVSFLTGQPCQWKDFLESRGIDTASWPVGASSCVAYLDKLGILDDHTLAVHLIHADARDMEILMDRNTPVCLCPRSNITLHQKLPDISLMLEKGLSPALGTDSLASCPSLDMRDEMVFVRKKFPQISPEQIIDMATINGGKALKMTHITGSLEPGKLAWFLKVPMEASRPQQIPERLISHEW